MNQIQISPKRLIFALSSVFVLGVLFSIVNTYYLTEAGSTLPLIVYGTAAIAGVAGAAIMYLFQSQIDAHVMKKTVKVLPRKERLILQALLDRNGEIQQNSLVAVTGLSHVQVSRTVKKLVQRNVVEKTSLGNTNLIVLTV